MLACHNYWHYGIYNIERVRITGNNFPQFLYCVSADLQCPLNVLDIFFDIFTSSNLYCELLKKLLFGENFHAFCHDKYW